MNEVRLPTGTTSTEAVMERLRQDILTGHLAPGQRLKVADLSARYGMSAIPVREALIHLEGEGIIERYAHRGAVIRPVDADFIFNMYEVRRVLETLMTGAAARRIRADDLVRLRRAREAHEAAVAGRGAAEIYAGNTAFHRVIYQASGNTEAERIVSRGWDLVQALRRRFGTSPARLGEIITEHREIEAALADGDADRAMRLADSHSARARDDLLKLLA